MELTVGLFAYIMIYEVPRDVREDEVQSVALLPDFEKDQVSALELQTTNETIRVEKQMDGNWKLVSPDDYPAENRVLEVLFEACLNVHSHKLVSEREIETQPKGLANYGLENPRYVLTLESGGQKHVIRVGDSAPSTTFTYVQVGDEKQLHLASAGFVTYIPPSADLVRSRSLLLMGEDGFDQFEIKTASGGFTAVRGDDGDWRITEPPPVKRADSYKLNLLAEQLRGWEVRAFVRVDNAEAVEKLGLKTPQATLTLSRDDEPLSKIEFGLEPEDQQGIVFARLGFQGNMVMVENRLLQALKLPFSEFRDRRLLNVDPSQVQRIEVDGSEGVFTLQKWPYDHWRFMNHTNLVADPAFTQMMVTNLVSLEILRNGWESDVVTDYKPFGLAQPSQTIKLFTTTNASNGGLTNVHLATLAIGTNDMAGKTFVKTDQGTSVYGVSTTTIDRVPQKVTELRDRRIWSYFLTNVVSVRISEKGKALKLAPNKTGKWSVIEGNGGINVGGFITTLFSVCQLEAEAWVSVPERQLPYLGITADAHSVEIEFNDNGNLVKRKLIIGKQAPNKNGFISTLVDGKPAVFELKQNVYELIRDFMPAPKL